MHTFQHTGLHSNLAPCFCKTLCAHLSQIFQKHEQRLSMHPCCVLHAAVLRKNVRTCRKSELLQIHPPPTLVRPFLPQILNVGLADPRYGHLCHRGEVSTRRQIQKHPTVLRSNLFFSALTVF